MPHCQHCLCDLSFSDFSAFLPFYSQVGFTSRCSWSAPIPVATPNRVQHLLAHQLTRTQWLRVDSDMLLQRLGRLSHDRGLHVVVELLAVLRLVVCGLPFPGHRSIFPTYPWCRQTGRFQTYKFSSAPGYRPGATTQSHKAWRVREPTHSPVGPKEVAEEWRRMQPLVSEPGARPTGTAMRRHFERLRSDDSISENGLERSKDRGHWKWATGMSAQACAVNGGTLRDEWATAARSCGRACSARARLPPTHAARARC